MSVHALTNPEASFAHYRTFSFGPGEGPPRDYQASSRAPEVQRLLESFIAAGLSQKGYAPLSEKGDLVIEYGFGRRTIGANEASQYPDAAWLPADLNGDFVEGSLVIDAFDAGTGARVWRGASSAQINSNHIDNDLLQRSVAGLLAVFPALQGRSDRPPATQSAVR